MSAIEPTELIRIGQEFTLFPAPLEAIERPPVNFDYDPVNQVADFEMGKPVDMGGLLVSRQVIVEWREDLQTSIDIGGEQVVGPFKRPKVDDYMSPFMPRLGYRPS